ncbi:SpoIIE family protein phosphatase [Ramlibacter sp. AN1015]|uniref:PP2C family protein-serine/threonine phosphatase n=1 Tax=Ramlibacter sp. AN1015 TaxID=3133428 RepID=UPI0030C0487C
MQMRVLVVDDLDSNRDLLMRRLQRLGHEADAAATGAEALLKLSAARWDLVLLDITMPDMDGYDTLRHIKADPALADTPVVMVSAIDETESVVRCLKLGADDYLAKPFEPAILQARVESALARKRLADQRRIVLETLQREMDIGQQIQQGFLPMAMPAVPGWDVAGACLPARQVSGDFYDAFELPSGRLALVVADVCNKGVGAALYMALFRTLIRAMACHAPAGEAAPQTLLRTLAFTNDYIASVHGHENMFASVFFAILDASSGHLDYLNAGHEPPLIKRRTGGAPQWLLPTGGAVGLFPGLRGSVASAALEPGDCLFGYTDGLTEAPGDGGAFGEAALVRAIDASGPPAGALLATVQARLAEHVCGADAHDDVTMLCVIRGTGRLAGHPAPGSPTSPARTP